jgi:hypothetical protein
VIFLIRVRAGAVRAAPLETGFGIGGQSLNPRRVARLRFATLLYVTLAELVPGPAMAIIPLYERRTATPQSE